MKHLTIKEDSFTLEINQSQPNKIFYAVVFKLTDILYTQEFDGLEIATQTGKVIFKAIVMLGKYRDLADKAQQEALFAKKRQRLCKRSSVFTASNLVRTKIPRV